MAGRYLSPGLVVSLWILCSAVALAAARKAGISIPKGSAGIFAYGSLISPQSLEGSLGHKYEGPAHEVHLAGFDRTWACVRLWNDPRAAAAGARRLEGYLVEGAGRVPILGAAELDLLADKKGRVNGVLYFLTEEELGKLDAREWGYRRVDVTGRIEEFRFRGGKVYAYQSLPRPVPGPDAGGGTYILIKEFLNGVLAACDKRGKAFREEFDRSTRPCSFPVVTYKDIVWGKAK